MDEGGCWEERPAAAGVFAAAGLRKGRCLGIGPDRDELRRQVYTWHHLVGWLVTAAGDGTGCGQGDAGRGEDCGGCGEGVSRLGDAVGGR